MEEKVAVSTLSWSWVVEALAKSRLVNVTLLYELLSKVPPLLGDSGKEAREAAALRCLEGFLGLNVSSENPVVSDLSKIVFDPAESCEAALQRILSETSGSKGGVSDELKRHIKSFVKHKKTSLRKSTLELLKDTILEGTLPFAASLKETSGLAVHDQCVLNVPFDGGEPISPSSRSDEDDHGDRSALAEENKRSPSGIDNQPVQSNFPNGSPLSCRVCISTRCSNHEQEVEAASLEMDNECPPAKKLKMDTEYGMQSKQQHSVPVGSNQMCNDAEDEEYREVVEENGVLDEKDDEQAKTNVENRAQQPISHYKVDHCLEEIDLALKNPNFLSSQCAFTRDSFAMSESQPNTCMKCNKDGQLLSCSASSCFLLFHESCLGCSASFDDQGHFYCPLCAYSRAKSEYVKAKEKVSLARKELSLFLGGRTGAQPACDGDTSKKDNVNQERHMNVDQTAEVMKGADNVRELSLFAGGRMGAHLARDGDTSLRDNVNRDRHLNVDLTTQVKKGANNVPQVAEPRQSNLTSKQLELSHSSTYMDANGFVLATPHLSFKDRQGAEIIIQLSRGPAAGIWNRGQHDHGCDEQILNGSVEFAELKRKQETTKCKITELHGDASSESISDSDGPLQDKSNGGTNSLAHLKPLSAIPVTPQFRRKKVPWTAEEEAILMKGVETFSVGDGRAIPWKVILEYGGSVFQKGRTAIDLKDKWRNFNRKKPSK